MLARKDRGQGPHDRKDHVVGFVARKPRGKLCRIKLGILKVKPAACFLVADARQGNAFGNRARARFNESVDRAAYLTGVARDVAHARLVVVDLFERDHRQIDVMLLEVKEARRIVQQHVGVEYKDARQALGRDRTRTAQTGRVGEFAVRLGIRFGGRSRLLRFDLGLRLCFDSLRFGFGFGRFFRLGGGGFCGFFGRIVLFGLGLLRCGALRPGRLGNGSLYGRRLDGSRRRGRRGDVSHRARIGLGGLFGFGGSRCGLRTVGAFVKNRAACAGCFG